MGGSVLQKRRLGNVLRDLRLRAGMTIGEAAPKLDFSPAKLSRIENAGQGVDVHAVRSMMDLFGVVGDRWEELLELTRAASTKGWWRAYGLDDRGYVPLEADATTVREFAASIVPGLLQTEDYARALFETSGRTRSASILQRDVTVRMIRQARLSAAEDPLVLHAVIEESVLHRVLGDRDVMAAQFTHLLEAAGLDMVTVQIVPTGVGGHPGLDGAFTVLSFEGLGEPDIAYVEHPMGALHLEQAQQVARARSVFDHLCAAALGPTESAALIEEVVAQM